MASRVMRWFGVMIGALALVAVWALPPRSPQEWFLDGRRRAAGVTSEERTFSTVNRELGRLAGLNRMLVWGDSLKALAAGRQGGGSGFVALLPDTTYFDEQMELIEGIRQQLQHAGVEVPAVPVGTVVMDRDLGRLPGASPGLGMGSQAELFVGTDPATPFCFLVMGADNQSWRARSRVTRLLWRGADSSAVPSPLGPCLFHAKYGTPGAEIFAWLSSGGYGFGVGTFGFAVWVPWYSSKPLVRGFGYRHYLAFSPEGQRCAQGQSDACRDLAMMTTPGSGWALSSVGSGLQDLGGFGVSVMRERGTGVGFGGLGVRIFSELEEQFGEEAFARFWTSDLEVEAAFRDAFGQSFEEWLVQWTEKQWGHSPAGPPIPPQAAALSFLSLGLMAGLALFIGRRKA